MSGINPVSKAYQLIRDKEIARLKAKYPSAMGFYDNYKPSTDRNTYDLDQPRSRMSLTPKTGLLTDKELRHLLRRTRFGVRRSELADLKDMNVDEIIDLFLTEKELDIPVNQYQEIEYDDDIAMGETFIDADYNTPEVESVRILSLKNWVQKNMLKEELSLQPMMWFFWQNHLVSEMYGTFYAYGSYRYLKLLHDFSFGNFQELMERITIDASMLLYLNGALNIKQAPDENYARELQELFCIGKGPDAAFTEGDVQEAARILTGYRIEAYGMDPIFRPYLHDEKDKQFSAFYGNKKIAGKSGEEGAEEYKELIQMIFENNEVAKFITRKLYKFFIYADIDEWTEENIITPLADTFRDNDYEIKPLLSQLFLSEHFYDELNRGAMIKSPMDFMYGIIDSCDLPKEKTDLTEDFYYMSSHLWRVANLGIQIGEPPNVAGWPAYYQAPNYDKSWITTNTITTRIQLTDAMVWWGVWTEYGKEEWDYFEFTKSLNDPKDPRLLIREISDLFLGIDLPEESVEDLRAILLSGQETDYYWTNAWELYIESPDDENLANNVRYRLLGMYQRFFQLAEFQLK